MNRRASHLAIGLALVGGACFWPLTTAADNAGLRPVPSAISEESALASFEASATAAGALGFYRDAVSGTIVVDVSADSASGFSLPDAPELATAVRERTVAITGTALQSTLRKLLDVMETLSARGASYAFFFNPEAAEIELHTSAAEESIASGLGADMSLVDYHLDPVVPLSRASDSAPFFGGAIVWRPPLGPQCTTGFEVKDTQTGKYMMVTAGHCFTAGNTVESGSNNVIGSVVEQWCGSTGKDMEVITGKTYSPLIYVGGATGTPSTTKGATDPSVNGNYWYSGSNTYSNPVTVTAVNGGGFNYGCGNMSDLIVAHKTGASGCPAITGDSGAPLYLPSGSTDYIRGMLVARDGSNCYFELWSTIRTTLGVTIVTG